MNLKMSQLTSFFHLYPWMFAASRASRSPNTAANYAKVTSISALTPPDVQTFPPMTHRTS